MDFQKLRTKLYEWICNVEKTLSGYRVKKPVFTRRLQFTQLEERVVPAILPPLAVSMADEGTDARFYPTGVEPPIDFPAYESEFRGGARSALGDLNNDGIADIVTIAGKGGGPRLVIFDGATGKQTKSIFAFDDRLRGGGYVAVGDVNNDGQIDIIAGMGEGDGARVNVFDGRTYEQILSFDAYDTTFFGGVRVASADVNNDGYADIITSPGLGGGPHIRVFSGKDGVLLGSFFAYDTDNRGGAHVGTGDVDGDGFADIIVGSGIGLPSRVTVFSGKDFTKLSTFSPYGEEFIGGVRVAVGGLSDGTASFIWTAAADGGGPRLRQYNSTTVFNTTNLIIPSISDKFVFDPSHRGGITVAAGFIPVAAPADLATWTVSERGGTAGQRGKVDFIANSATLSEGTSFVTSLSQSFVVPNKASNLSFTIVSPLFDGTADGLVRDSFEAALLDDQNRPLTPTIGTGLDSFLNLTEGQTIQSASAVSVVNDKVTLDLSGIAPGTRATLLFRLVNNDTDTLSKITIDNVSLPVPTSANAPLKFFIVDAGANKSLNYGVEGANAGSFAISSNPSGAASNSKGDTLWVVDASTKQIHVYDNNGITKGTWTATDSVNPQGVTIHNGDLWLVDRNTLKVLQYTGGAVRTSGNVASSSFFTLDALNANPSDLVTDGATFWVTDDSSKQVFVYDIAGASLGRWQLDADNAAPSGITRDPTGGTDLWVVDRGTKQVFHYANGTNLRSGQADADGTFNLGSSSIQPEGIADPPQSPEGYSLLDNDGRVLFDSADDFRQGTLFNLTAVDATGDIRLNEQGQTQIPPFIWISNSGEGTVSRFDTRTGVEVGRYRTGPSGGAHSPSRTAVASDGSVWVANRAFGIQSSIVHVLLDGFIDRNGNGVMDTSFDKNGNGKIDPDEVMPWDANGDGLPDDERIAISISVGRNPANPDALIPNGLARAVAIDADDNVWVGLFNLQQYEVYNQKGQLIKTVSTPGTSPYGAVIDNKGQLWGATLSGRITQIDTNTQAFVRNVAVPGGTYGITVDPQGLVWTSPYPGSTMVRFDPATDSVTGYSVPAQSGGGIAVDDEGAVWFAGFNTNKMWKFTFESDRKTLINTEFVTVGATPKAASIDADGYLWTTTLGDNKAWKIDTKTNTVVPGWPITTGQHPYNYSDMTGRVRLGVTQRTGTFTEIIDATRPNAVWGGVELDAFLPDPETSVVVRVRAADDAALLPQLAWRTLEPETAYRDLRGRYLEVQVSLRSREPDFNPVVNSFAVVNVLPPTLSVSTPPANSVIPANNEIVLNGQALASQPNIGATVFGPNRIIAVTVNGTPVNSLDALGRFFAKLPVLPGENTYTISAFDEFGQSTTHTHSLTGDSRPTGFDQSQFVDLSATFKPQYARTSFDEDTRSLFAQIAVRNTGNYPAGVPLYVAVRNISDPRVRLLNTAGTLEDGTPYYDFTGLVTGGKFLNPDATTGQLEIAFSVPNRKRFTYDLQFLGVLNRAPVFTTIPSLEAYPGRTYRYDANATDPDGDALTYALVAGPAGMSIETSTGKIAWMPTDTQLGTFEVTIQATDGRGGTAEQRYTILSELAPPNRPPVFTSLPVETAIPGVLYTYDADALDPDNDTLTYSLGVDSPQGMAIDPVTGLITWTPTAAAIGHSNVTVIASDGNGGIATQNYAICFAANPNRPPIIVSEPGAFVETGNTYNYTVLSLDPDGGPLTYSLTRGPAGMTINPASGLVSWTLTRGANLVENFDFSEGNQQFQTSLTYSPNDGWPSGVYTIRQRTGGWNGEATDFGDHTTGTGFMMVVNGSTIPDHLVWGQTVAVQPNTTYDFSFWARSWTSGSPGRLQLRVNASAVGAELTLPMTTDQWVEYTGTWFSGSSTSAIISINNATSAFGGNDFAIDDISFATSGLSLIGQSVPVTVRVDDGHGGSDEQSFTVTVTDTEVPPQQPTVYTSTSASVRTPFRYTVGPADGSNYTLISAPQGLQVHPTLGVAAWYPFRDQVGTHQVVVKVDDSQGNTTLKTIEITVIQPNTAPIITSTPSNKAIVSLPYRYEVHAQDAENDSLIYSLQNPLPGMSIDAKGVVTWTPTASDVGVKSVTVLVSDGVGGVTDQSFAINVVANGPNTAPVAKLLGRTSAIIGKDYLAVIAASDADGDSLTYSVFNGPSGMTIDGAGVIRWDNVGNLISPVPVAIRVSDGRPDGDTLVDFAIELVSNFTNSAPVITSIPRQTGTIGSVYGYDLVARDADGDLLMWTLVDGPDGASIDADRGTLRWEPMIDQSGKSSFTVQVMDAFGTTATQTFTVSVSCVNQPPRITSVPGTIGNANYPYAYAVRAFDPEGDALTFSLESAPAGMAFIPGTSIIRWIPTSAQVGPQTATVLVTDAVGNTVTQTFTVLIEAGPPNRAPIITSQAKTIATIGNPYSYTLTASDPDGDPLQFALLTGPEGMVFEAPDRIVWTPAAAGSFVVSVAVEDNRGGVGTQTFTLIARENQAPVLAPIADQKAAAGAKVLLSVSATDPDQDVISFSLDAAPAGMIIDSFGRIMWASNQPPRAETITVRATDTGGLFATQSFTLTLTDDTTAPEVSVFVNPSVVNFGSVVSLQVSATDNVAVTSLILEAVLHGVRTPVALTPQGAAMFTTAGPGRYSFVATAKDAAGNVGTANAELRAIDPADVTGPTVAFTKLVELLPNNQSREFDVTKVTASVQYLTDVYATITDPNLDNWTVRIARADQVNYQNFDIFNPAFTTIATGTTAIADNKVALFDPTTLTDDRYVLGIVAYDINGQGTVRGIEVDVSGGVKLGEFSLTFTDLSLPLNGIPIQIDRVYDSRESNSSGEFGFGWRLGARDARIRETVPPGPGYGLFSVAQPYRTGTKIFMNLPDGRRAGFKFAPQTAGGSLFGMFSVPKFLTDPGFEGYRLEVDSTSITQRSDGTWAIFPAFFSFDYNPDDFRLITPEGLTYFYNQHAGLQKITDQNNNLVTFTNDGIFHSGGFKIDFIRDGQGRITEIIDAAGKSLKYTYDAAGDLRTFADQMVATTKFNYNPAGAHYLDEIIDPSGRSAVKTEYDASGRVIAITDANGNRVVRESDPLNFRETIRDARGNPTILTYNERGNITSKTTPTDFGPVVEQYFYEDPLNPDLETKIINPRGFITAKSYDSRGNLLTETNSDGTTKYTYNAANKLTSVVDTLGRTTAYQYSPQGNLVRVVNALGDDSLFTYDSLGRVTSFEDFAGNTTMFLDYCACGRPKTIQNPDGSIRRLETNAFSQITKVTDEIGNITQNFYDDAGRLIRVVDGVGATTRYEYQTGTANVVRIIDPLGNTTEYKYDGANNKTHIIDAEGGVTIFGYDKANNLVSVIDPVNNETKFIYDQANRLKEEIDPLGKSRFFTLDAAGNKISILDRNNKTRTFAYDALNRNTQENWLAADGSVVRVISTSYDKAGNLLTANDPDAKLSYTYDALNRVKTATTEYPGTNVPITTLTYGYDANGNRTSVVDNFGVRVDSVYSDRNQLLSQTMQGGGVSAARVEFEYADNGERKLLKRFADATGTTLVGSTSYAYFANGISKTITHKNAVGGTLVNYDYLYDLAGRLKSEVHHGDTYQYSYDKTGQLLTVNKGGTLFESFSYDKNGNRKTSTGPNGNQTYAPAGAGNRLLNDGKNIYTYDAEGNLKTKTVIATGVVTEYTWDHRNRIMNVEQRSIGGIILSSIVYKYDVIGRRICQSHNGSIVYTYYDRDNSWFDALGNGSIIDRYLFSDDTDDIILRANASDGARWHLADKLGTTRDLISSLGSSVYTVHYSAFGTILTQSNSIAADRFMFAGREYDASTGNYYNRARYYNPESSRFLSSDPLGITNTESNLYRYVHNRPTDLVDPTGLFAIGEYSLVTITSATTIAAITLMGAFTVTYLFAPVAALEASGYPGQHNGPGDAMRHCIWMAYTASVIGAPMAILFGYLHELNGMNPADEKSMDLHNNGVGASIGAGGDRSIILSKCDAALTSGQLIVLPRSRW